MSSWSRGTSKLSIVMVTGVKWKLMISFNRFEIKRQIKCVITAHKSFKSPLNTILALQGKYQKIKITQKVQIKNFHFRLILTLEQYNWTGIYVNMADNYLPTIHSLTQFHLDFGKYFTSWGDIVLIDWCLTYKLQLICHLHCKRSLKKVI